MSAANISGIMPSELFEKQTPQVPNIVYAGVAF